MISKIFVLIFTIQSLTQMSIRPRDKMPEFKATGVLGEKTMTVNSRDHVGKYMVLIFYPFDFTYVCPTEIIAFSEKMDQFKQLNSVVYGVSTDSAFTHLAWIKTPRN